ncbi:MAG TPA: VWA domain-containing protein [Vicinamibacterales bacterium]|jgi:VWFA-related protein
MTWIACALIVGQMTGVAAPSQHPQPVARSGSILVRLTVVARDHRGAFVGSLTADDFKVSEDGKPVTASFFTEVTGAPAVSSAPTTTVPTGAFSNLAAATAAPNVTVILFDRLNTKWEDQARAREQLKTFFAKLRPDDRVAVYALDDTALRVIHDFTSDASALVRAISDNARPDSPAAELQTAAPANLADEYVNQLSRTTALTTFTALETIGQHLAGIPGRKNLVWVSNAFPIPPNAEYNRTQEIERAARSLNTANISLYGIDTRGLIGAVRMTATSDTFVSMNTVNGNHEVIEALTERTGGRAFFNNNDTAGSVRRAIDDSEHHYEFDYYSPASTPDDRYRVISAVVKKSGVDLQYRRGYFATLAAAPGGDRKTILERTLANPLDATGILLDVTPTPRPNGMELAIHADAGNLAFLNRAGVWSDALDLAIAQLRDDGTSTIDVDTTITLHLNEGQHHTIISNGLTITKTIVVLADTSRVVVVVRDAATGAVGSVVISAASLRGASQSP